MEQFKKLLSAFRPAFTITVVLMLVCGLGFPLLLNGLSAVLFPHQANGSMVEYNGKEVGAEFVGQEFTEDYFMKCRPSAYHYNTYTTDEDGNEVYLDGSEFGGVSSGSNNYAPTNPDLVARVESDMDAFLEKNPNLTEEDIPTDLMTASGSGLDPHITPDSAMVQLPMISKASGISEEKLTEIVKDNTKGKLLGVFGEETVNVLGVNVAIAEEMGI